MVFHLIQNRANKRAFEIIYHICFTSYECEVVFWLSMFYAIGKYVTPLKDLIFLFQPLYQLCEYV